jgi:glycosyltransferase involved in cell wall biosynthesis
MPYQDRKTLNQSLNLADVHLVSQLPAFTGIVVPSKLYGILAVGKPSIMIGPADAECSRVISETASGYVIPNGDAAALVQALRYLKANPDVRQTMGSRARQAFQTNYDCPIACSRIETILQSVVDAP